MVIAGPVRVLEGHQFRYHAQSANLEASGPNQLVSAMKVLVDSNQFIADFLLESAPFRYLMHFLNNEGHTLLLSRLVLEEVENKYSTEIQKAFTEASKSNQRLEQLGLSHSPAKTFNLELPLLNLEQRIREQIDSVQILEYENVPQAQVVQRALNRRKPFDADGATGYRDCLLWLSLICQLASDTSNTDEEVIFISSNWKDFYQAAPVKQAVNEDSDKASSSTSIQNKKPTSLLKIKLHDDLIADLTSLKQSVSPFYTVAAFVDTKVDKAKHVISYDKCYELFEDYLEEQGLEALQHPGSESVALVLRRIFPISTASALTILDARAEIFDGLEDLHIYLAEEVGNKVYVSCGFDLLQVDVTLTVPRTQFDAHRAEIEGAVHLLEVREFEDKVDIRIFVRSYYQASFDFDPKTQNCSGFSLQTFDAA